MPPQDGILFLVGLFFFEKKKKERKRGVVSVTSAFVILKLDQNFLKFLVYCIHTCKQQHLGQDL
jgi:hypothetical protein